MAEREHLQNLYGKEAPTKKSGRLLILYADLNTLIMTLYYCYFSLVSCGNVKRTWGFWAQRKHQIIG